MPRQSSYHPPSEQTLQIIDDLKRNESLTSIAARYGITRQRVHQIAKRHAPTRAERRELIEAVPGELVDQSI